jgi:DNA gyrase/topoisomerase IV subunit B
MTTKPIFKHKKLDEISHVLLRPGRYLGSIAAHTAVSYLVNEETQKMEEKELTWCPGFIKMFDEVISNSVDFSKTKEGAHVTTIKVDIADNGEISVFDDGGIAVLKNPEYDQYIPEYIFELRAGSNFDDDDDSTLTGQNGEGAALTNIFSQHFIVKTADGKKEFEQKHTENSRVRSEPKIKTSDKRYTKITYLPDYAKLGLTKLDEGNYAKLVKRVYDVAGCNPKLKVYLNGKQIKIKSFKDYIEFYATDYVYDETDHWKVGIAKSDGFKHVSFVNTTETSIGGEHIRYLQEQITRKLREYFNKKHKVDVKPSEILNHIQLFVDATIIKPRYSSQTKEDLITEPRNFGTSFEITEKTIQKLTKSDIIQSVLDWVQTKADAEERRKLRELNKETDKMNPNRIPKFCDATEKKDRSKCMLFITEGDSAAKAIISAKTEKNAKYIGSFPLKGKPLNVNDVPTKRLVENDEFRNFMAAMGLRLGVKVEKVTDLRFGMVIIMSDQDLDGFHIRGLEFNMLSKFWPELFELGMVYMFRTPLVRVFIDKPKKVINFYSENEFDEWEAKNKDLKYRKKYYKGLATSDAKDFKSYLEDMDTHLIPITIDGKEDTAAIDLAFSKGAGSADKRKVWLELE